MGHHLTLVRTAIIETEEKLKVLEKMWGRDLKTVSGTANWYSYYEKLYEDASENLKQKFHMI